MKSQLTGLVVLMAIAQLAPAQDPHSPSYTLTANGPAPVQSVSARASAPGTGTYCYWIVATYPIGKTSPSSPACITNAAGTVTVNWSPAPGASSYDVLRTTTTTFPATPANIAVATGVTGNSQTDSLGAASSYTATTAPPASATVYLDNQNYSVPTVIGWNIGGGGGSGCVPAGAAGQILTNNGSSGCAGSSSFTFLNGLLSLSTAANLPNGSPGTGNFLGASPSANNLTMNDGVYAGVGSNNWWGQQSNFYESGLWNTFTTTLAGAGINYQTFNGMNRSDLKDSTFGLVMIGVAGAPSQKTGIANILYDLSPGDGQGSQNQVYSASESSAQGDEGLLASGNNISEWPFTIQATLNAVVNAGISTTLAGNSAATTDPRTPSVISVTSSAGMLVGQWLTVDPYTPQRETFQITAVGTGTVSGIVRYPHSIGATIATAPQLSDSGSIAGNSTNYGQQRLVVNLSGPAVTTGSVDVLSTAVTAHGGANFTNGMVGGNAANPGCIAFPIQDVPVNGVDALAANINNSTTTVTLQVGNVIETFATLTIGGEMMYVTAGGLTTTLTVIRGYNGTTAASHAMNDGVVQSLRSWRLLSGTSGGNATMVSPLTWNDMSINAPNPSYTGVSYVVRPCSRIGALPVTYSQANGEKAAALVLEANSFSWSSGNTIAQGVPPNGAIEATVQGAIQQWWGPITHVQNGMIKAVNQGHIQMNSAFFMDGSVYDSSTTAGYTYGLWFVGNTAQGAMNIGGLDLSGIGIGLTTAANDPKKIHWEGGGMAASIYPETADFVIDAQATGKVKFRNSGAGAGNDVTFDFSANSTPQTLKAPLNASGSLALVNPGSIGTVTLGPNPGDTTELGFFANPGVTGVFYVDLNDCCGDNGSRHYVFEESTGEPTPQGTWFTVLPASRAPASPTLAYDLDVMQSNADSSFHIRVRRTGGAAGSSTLYPTITIINGIGASPWTTTGSTNTGVSAPSGRLPSATLTMAGGQTMSSPIAFASLGSVPVAGSFVYCSDCTTAATCAGSGSGHLAVSNGTNWTCQ